MSLEDEASATAMTAAINRLAKWRMVFASWQLGTRSKEDGECNAVRDHRETTILLRAEMNALMGLLVKAGVFTAEDYKEAMREEADLLSLDYEKEFPGFRATDDGMKLEMPLASETIKRMHFPP